MSAADALASGAVAAGSRQHTAWSSANGSLSAVHDADETLVRMPSVPVDTFELAPDGALVACASDGSIALVSEAGEQRVQPEAIAAGGTSLACVDVAIGASVAVWALLGANDVASAVPDVVCHLDASGWSCSPLQRRATRGTLCLTPQHAWWVGATDRGMPAQLLALPRATPSGVPSVVLDDAGADGTLRASSVSESVVVVPPVSASDQTLQRIALDGTTVSLLARSEAGAYTDVWLTRDDRVLALDVVHGETPHCSSGALGYGGGCSSTIDWTQLVVYELATTEPHELAHADYEGGGQRSIGIERSHGVVVAGDRWYEVP